MNTFANAISNTSTMTRTENGDLTYSTTQNACLDLFGKVNAIRGQGYQRTVNLFSPAYKEDPELASRIMLWSRDIREGAGERQTFKDVLLWLELNDTERLVRILPKVPEMGRFSDLFVFKTKKIKEMVYEIFAEGLRSKNGLASKWAPREGSKNKEFAYELMQYLKLSPRDYRKMIVAASDTVEQKMTAKNWDEINFSHVPSVASARYSKAFWKHQTERYQEFVQKAVKGEVKINTSALFPYDVVKRGVNGQTANALWNQLPDYVPEGVSFLPMIDTSASMNSPVGTSGVSCMDVSVSMGIYLAERNKSAFKGLGLTFNSIPKWITVPKTDDIMMKMNHVRGASWGGSTNLDSAMESIVDLAIQNRVAKEDMPAYLIVISDMEFDYGQGYGAKNQTASDRTKARFASAGYEVPTLVWWNVQSRGMSTPVRSNATGEILVSGLSATITKTVLSGKQNPMDAMLETVMVDRYNH